MSTAPFPHSSDDSESAAPVYRVGDLVVDTVRERVARGESEICLPKLSFDLLAALARAAPELVSVGSLMSEVWPGLVVGPETVVQRVKLLRAALGDDSKQPRYIEGVRGRGYRVVAPVKPFAASARVTSVAEAPKAARGARRRLSPRTMLTAGTTLLALIAAAVGFAWFSARSTSPTEPAVPRVAILPFENLSPDSADTFFADGMHHEIINALAQSAPSIGVIARTTMMTYRDGKRASAHDVARDLNATHVIEATVRRDAQRVRLTVTLVDARTETSLWSHPYDEELTDALALQSQVAADVAAQLSVRLREPAAQAANAGTRNSQAYDAYLQGLVARPSGAFMYAQPTEIVRAVEAAFTTAIELDPTFADAYAERMAARITQFFGNADTSDAQLQRIKDDLAAAERLAPRAMKTLAARGAYLGYIARDIDGALAAFSAAEAAGLADPMWMDRSVWLVTLGRYDEAIRQLEQLRAIDPRSTVVAGSYGYHLEHFHRPQDALRGLNFAIEQSPQDPILPVGRAMVLFAYTGNLQPLNAFDPVHTSRGAWSKVSDSVRPIAFAFEVLRWNGRFGELDHLLSGVSIPALRAIYPAVGLEPVARYRGWTHLLLGDRVAAADDGRSMLEFLASSAETDRNRFFRRLVAAEAHTFTGDNAAALVAARDALADPSIFGYLAELDLGRAIAAVYAWNGAHGEAVDLLERLLTETPGVGPGEVARDPLYTIPLAQHARFQSLAARLEADMRAARLD